MRPLVSCPVRLVASGAQLGEELFRGGFRVAGPSALLKDRDLAGGQSSSDLREPIARYVANQRELPTRRQREVRA